MPHTISMRARKISVTEVTVTILKIYQTAISHLEEEQKTMLGLSPETKPRAGFVPSVVKATVERVTQSKQGATEHSLGPIESSLNGFAYQLTELLYGLMTGLDHTLP